ncbi:hypothetical protein [Calothrix sp. UHCC 0171]|uniref:hypothetical protein n=1 Tax=Calothrix sp. UHCC 0171 TaxID=3110245 RepID=UPI002B1F664E|nr:hypothetical protein [Calothrix sp. UHCC 0171]MEA5572334.1 hypothetical protein [Calothrix sp. UHCC 0171]
MTGCAIADLHPQNAFTKASTETYIQKHAIVIISIEQISKLSTNHLPIVMKVD